MSTVKALEDGEFGVSLEDSIQPVKFDGEGDVEIFSTWVKAKWTRVAVSIDDETRKKLVKFPSAQYLSLQSSDLVVRNDIDDIALDTLRLKNFISWDIHLYCKRNQVDEIIFRG